jgi:hypothetical protein
MSAALDTGNVSTLAEVPLDELVLDPQLQCRTGINQEAVEEYAEALRAGASFPPVKAIRVGASLLLVDGWHRVNAWDRACRGKPIPCEVREGTRRDALIAAAGANAHHGLRRSQADKRRAVAVLLMDPELCEQSSRDLARLVGVSHTYINQVRKAYGVGVGEVLTAERQAQVDGEPTPRWKAILENTERWNAELVGEWRLAPNLDAILKLEPQGYGTWKSDCRSLRLEELATEPWPWPEDRTAGQRAARADRLDVEEDLRHAIVAADCPDRDTLYLLLLDLRRWRTDGYSLVDLPGIEKRLAKRPKLLEEVHELFAKKEAERAAEQANSPYHQMRQIAAAKGNPDEQAKLVAAAPDDIVARFYIGDLSPIVRDGVYRRRRDPEGKAVDCPDPTCGAWALPDQVCVACHCHPEDFAEDASGRLTAAAELLEHGGFGIRIVAAGLDIMVDRQAVSVLHALVRSCEHPPDRARILKALPIHARSTVEDWLAAEDPPIVGSNKVDEKPSASDDDDHVEDDDAGDAPDDEDLGEE